MNQGWVYGVLFIMIIFLQFPSCFIWEEDSRINLNGKNKTRNEKDEENSRGERMQCNVHPS